MRPHGAYRAAVRSTSVAICMLGVAAVVATLARGGGPLAIGVVGGALLALAGAGRFWLAVAQARDESGRPGEGA